MHIRNCRSEDYLSVRSILKSWWNGRDMKLPRLFFEHFQDTSFIIENEKEEMIGFLIGFLSQSQPHEAYIHFVGVHPDYRRKGLALKLYQLFFEKVKKADVRRIRCVTSIINKASISFHTQIGFEVVKGDQKIDGVDVHSNHGGIGVDRVLFLKQIQ